MIQIALMLLAPAQNLPVSSNTAPAPARRMATRPAPGIARAWRQSAAIGFAVAGNALGLLLFFAGLGLVLRLLEVLLS